ncbi:MAG: PQQ-binding-like beta-propeller repeat protein [Bilifractor sp.]|jgi:hypothetical protein
MRRNHHHIFRRFLWILAAAVFLTARYPASSFAEDLPETESASGEAAEAAVSETGSEEEQESETAGAGQEETTESEEAGTLEEETPESEVAGTLEEEIPENEEDETGEKETPKSETAGAGQEETRESPAEDTGAGENPENSSAETGGSGSQELSAYWKNFRGSDTNMAVTDAPLPTDPKTTGLLWNHKFGSGWEESPSVPILVDDSLVVMAGRKIYRLDLKNGQPIVSGTMAGAPDWGNTPPTYGDGKIFCPIEGGRVQAFDARTLKSLWIYSDPLGGQSLTPITYSDGYLYTGFWQGEQNDGAFVAIPVSDEDPSRTDEPKNALWRYVQKGGFYWSCPVVCGDAVIVGTDDGVTGSTGTGHLLSFRKQTGELLSDLGVPGDQRSGIAYDEESGRVYFTTKSGWLCSASVDSSAGTLSDLKKNKCGEMSTSTPVVYKGRVYLGVGDELTSSGSRGRIVVADASDLRVIYQKDLRGYPQGSFLLTTAYEEETGYLYIYSTYNASPGGISVLKTKADATGNGDAEVFELYNAAGFEQYCTASLICGEDGTIYYKNDSGNILAVGTGGKQSNSGNSGTGGNSEGSGSSGTGENSEGSGSSETGENPEGSGSSGTAGTSGDSDSSGAGESSGNSGNCGTSHPAGDWSGRYPAAGETVSADDGSGLPESASGYGTFSEDPEVSDLILSIRELASQDNPSEAEIIALYQRYQALTEAQKAQVSNFSDLSRMTEEQGAKNHTDAATGLSVSGVQWYLRLEVTEITEGSDYEAIQNGIASNELLAMWNIRLVNTLTGEETQPDSPVTLTMTVPDGAEGITVFQTVRINADGRMEYIDCTVQDGTISWETDTVSEFALVGGVSGAEGTLEEKNDRFSGSEDDAEIRENGLNTRSSVPWIILISAGAAAFVVVGALKRRLGKEDAVRCADRLRKRK